MKGRAEQSAKSHLRQSYGAPAYSVHDSIMGDAMRFKKDGQQPKIVLQVEGGL